MQTHRRNFFKGAAASALFYIFKPQQAEAFDKQKSLVDAGIDPKDIDKDLHFLSRDQNPLPNKLRKYYSSYYQQTFQLYKVGNGEAVFKVENHLGENAEVAQKMDFFLFKEKDRVVFQSKDYQYNFFWRPGFGFYALDPQNPERIVEYCHPLNVLPNLSSYSVNYPLEIQDELICNMTRKSFWQEGVPRSPLKGLQGFTEEMLYVDTLEDRDNVVISSVDRFLRALPLSRPILKTIAICSPDMAVKLLEYLLPRAFGWMIGPTKKLEDGKLLLPSCPYRKRLGTQPCESTCGHVMGKYFTEELGVPLRFDPTVNNYTHCHVLIGKKQFSGK